MKKYNDYVLQYYLNNGNHSEDIIDYYMFSPIHLYVHDRVLGEIIYVFPKYIRNVDFDIKNPTDDEILREFGNRCKELLVYKHMDLNDLEDITGISRVSLSKYVNDKVMPNIFTIRKIASALNVDPYSLLIGAYREY